MRDKKWNTIPLISTYYNGMNICILDGRVIDKLVNKYKKIIDSKFFVSTPNFDHRDDIITINEQNRKYIEIYKELGIQFIEENPLAKSL